MPIIRRVFGPFSPEITRGKKWNESTRVADDVNVDMRWYFIGIRADKTTGHWTLVYNIETRKFQALNNKISDSLIGRSRLGLVAQGIAPDVTTEDAHPDAWLDDEPVMQGTITQILKSKLSAEHIARAMALTIMRK